MSLDQILQIVVPAIAMVVGLFLKRAPWFNTKFIPVASVAVAVLIRFAMELGVPIPSAKANASVLALNWGMLLVIVRSIVDALLATGAHSAIKNVSEGVKESA